MKYIYKILSSYTPLLHSHNWRLTMQGLDDHENLPSPIADLIGTTHVFEIRSQTYYEYGTFESFTCWTVDPHNPTIETTSSSTVDNKTDVAGSSSKPVSQSPSLITPSKPENRRRNRWSKRLLIVYRISIIRTTWFYLTTLTNGIPMFAGLILKTPKRKMNCCHRKVPKVISLIRQLISRLQHRPQHSTASKSPTLQLIMKKICKENLKPLVTAKLIILHIKYI